MRQISLATEWTEASNTSRCLKGNWSTILSHQSQVSDGQKNSEMHLSVG